VVKSDFRKTSVKDVQYVKKPNVASALPDNILNAIDKLDTTAVGTRLVYEIHGPRKSKESHRVTAMVFWIEHNERPRRKLSLV
jgi:hypothetical protein